MQKAAVRRSFALVAVLSLFLAGPAYVPAKSGTPWKSLGPGQTAKSGQDIDPFYLKLLEGGRKSLLEKDYGPAARDLEVAAFGLWRDKKLAGKAYAYLALVRAALSEKEKSLAALRRAVDLAGPDGLASLELEAETLASLKKLAQKYGLASERPAAGENAKIPSAAPEKKPAPAAASTKAKPEESAGNVTKPPETKAETKPISPSAAPAPDLNALEERVRRDPADTGAALELAGAYAAAKNYREARRVLEALAARRPKDVQVAYSLAKANFFLGDFKAALERFRALSKPSSDASAGSVPALRAAIYTALCLDQLGRRTSADSFLSYVRLNTTPEELERIIDEEGLAEYRAALKR